MPTGHVKKIAESSGTMSPQPGGSFRSEGRSGVRRDLFETGIRELARSLLEVPPADLGEALRSALRVLGPGLRADRVDLHLFDSDEGEQHRLESWTALSTGSREGDSPTPIPTPPLDREMLSWRSFATRGGSDSTNRSLIARLTAGEVVRLGASHPLESTLESTTKPRVARIWSAARSVLLVPCVGPGADASKSLLGLFVVEAGLAASTWSQASIDQAQLVASLVAGALERHRLQQELIRLRERREHDEGLEILGRVAGSVAHDFNNVLTAILGYAELLEMDLAERGAEAPELLEIREAALRASELVEQVLGLGRNAGSDLRPLDLSAFVEKLESMIQRVLGKEIVVGLDLAEDLDPVEADPGRLERALLNLASNARAAIAKGSEAAGRFDLSTRMVDVGADGFETPGANGAVQAAGGPGPKLPKGRYVRLTARDDGCGIAPTVRDRIFESFYTTRSEEGGTGLGLASVLEFVESVGGAIRVESALRKGAAFHLYFPVRAPEGDPLGPATGHGSSPLHSKAGPASRR